MSRLAAAAAAAARKWSGENLFLFGKYQSLTDFQISLGSSHGFLNPREKLREPEL